MAKMAEALMINLKTICNHYKRHSKGGLRFLITNNGEAFLNNKKLAQQPQKNIYQAAKEIAYYIKQTGQISSKDAMSQLLHRLKLIYQKAKLTASKTGAEKQCISVVRYQGFNFKNAPEYPLIYVCYLFSLVF